MKTMAALLIVSSIISVALMELIGSSSALDIHQFRQLASKHNVTSMLVFGDSTVDPGNNNFLNTDVKGNFPPYGLTFFGRKPTGRFCDGRLVTDFFAEAIGFPYVPASLDPTLTKTDLSRGVSFASAATGYDDLTANLSNVISFSEQVKHFLQYKGRLNRSVGPLESKRVINNAIFFLSMGTNDFLLNYFLDDARQKQFPVSQYIDFLSSRMLHDAEMLHRLGARRLAVVGVPPIGCFPIVKTLRSQATCDQQLNEVSFSFNSKIKNNLSILRSKYGLKSIYIDAYFTILNAIKNPHKYGFNESSKGCCGTGTFELGVTCKGKTSCTDPFKHVFWDALHPTQRMYQILFQNALSSFSEDFLF